MNQAEATQMVETALEQRRKFGKHFTVSDMPPEFLDALVMEFDRLKAAASLAYADGIQSREDRAKALHEELVLAKRQLGAAKSRETQLRKQLASVTKQTEV